MSVAGVRFAARSYQRLEGALSLRVGAGCINRNVRKPVVWLRLAF
jgi:hypothetical protein